MELIPHLTRAARDHQPATRVVVASSECDGTPGTPGTEWYYGGTGYGIGSTARSGSVTAPEDEGNNGGSTSGDGRSGDDGGDDGGGYGGE